jgi:RNA polymerase sigma-70 factor (ECF subfamily)
MFNGIRKYTEMSDSRLSALFAESSGKSEKAFRVFYRRHHIVIFSFFLESTNMRADAEDMHQITFERYLMKVRSGVIPDNPRAYLFKIAKNVLVNFELSKYYGKDEQKTAKYEFYDSIEEIENQISHDMNVELEAKELTDLIKQAVSNIDKIYAEPFVDRFFYNQSVKEVAEKYELSYDGAKKRIARAKSQVQFLLKPYIDDINNEDYRDLI